MNMVFYHYELSIVNSDYNPNKVIKKIQELRNDDEGFMYLFAFDIYDYSRKDKKDETFELAGNGYWDRWSKELSILSKTIPNVVFKLRRELLDDEEDICVYYFKNGHIEYGKIS